MIAVTTKREIYIQMFYESIIIPVLTGNTIRITFELKKLGVAVVWRISAFGINAYLCSRVFLTLG